MIVNIEQHIGQLIISYVNKEGQISYMKFNIPSNQQYQYVYAKQRSNAIPGFMSWDNKPVNRVPSQFLNKYRIQELYVDAGENVVKPLFELNFPKLYSCDIEVDVTDDGFAEPGDANNRINTIAWSCFPDVIVFGLKPLSGKQIDDIEKEINKHLKSLGKVYKFIYKQFNNESEMIHDFLYNYARHAPLISGWNFWNYDWRYIYNRCKKLNLNISWMSPRSQWYKHRIIDRNKKIEIMLPQHKLIVDYMEIYKKWDRTVDVKENNSLDFVAEKVLNIKKVKYSGTFKDLYNEFDKYVFYNAIDTILVEQMHYKIKTMNTFLGLGNITRVEAMSAFSPINMIESVLVNYAYKHKKVFPKSHIANERLSYEGAFVFEPKPDLYEWVISLDYASLYPTIIRQFKISIENLIAKDKELNPRENQVKCISGAIFDKTTEPLLPEMLTDYYNKRKEAKKISQDAEKQLNKLQNILNERLKKSEDLIVN